MIVLSKDQLKATHMRKKELNIIINLDDAGQPGTHWVALHKSNGFIYYFDSYGFPAPKNVENLIKKHGTPNKRFYSSFEIQQDKSNRCGFYTLAFLSMANMVKTPEDIAKILGQFSTSSDQKAQNDKQLLKMIQILSTNDARALLNQTGAGLVDKFISWLPFEVHMPDRNEIPGDKDYGKIQRSHWTGPGTRIAKRSKPNGEPQEWSQGISRVDKAARIHDLAYDFKSGNPLEDNKIKKQSDRYLMDVADEVRNDPKTHPFNKATATLVRTVIGQIEKRR